MAEFGNLPTRETVEVLQSQLGRRPTRVLFWIVTICFVLITVVWTWRFVNPDTAFLTALLGPPTNTLRDVVGLLQTFLINGCLIAILYVLERLERIIDRLIHNQGVMIEAHRRLEARVSAIEKQLPGE
jgi:TRAP-type C4-dicarboxylate transport system permease small subunit